MEINETKETVFSSFKQKINNAEEELEDIYIVQVNKIFGNYTKNICRIKKKNQ